MIPVTTLAGSRRVQTAALAVLLLFGAMLATTLWRIATVTPGRTDVAPGLPLVAPIDPTRLAITVDPGAIGDSAAPGRGVTGTTALPALPVSAAVADAIVAGETGVVAAQPFSLGRASTLDRDRALQCLGSAIYYEAASEPDAGQRAVAQVILNRVRHPAFPATVCGVVYQGSEKAGCQFSFACDGAMARVPARAAMLRATRVAAAALAGYVYAPVGLATHYHTYAVTPAWNRALVMTDAVGAHFFHRWKGYWGTARAFSQSYRGGEPLPGSHAPVVPTLPVVAAVGVTGVATVAPAGVVAVTPAPVVGPLLESGQVLDRWKDSGTPLVR